MRVLTVNTGSSSVKLRLLDARDEVVSEEESEAPQTDIDERGLSTAVARMGRADAVAHRIVHGGDRTEPALLDAALHDELARLASLAPLHQPKSLAAVSIVGNLLPDVPAVACFDTAFHARMPARAAMYALPAEWRERFALRRYGFHGLSHAYASRRVAELVAPAGVSRIVTCHLGAGASLAAVTGGRSIDTTMGFTPLEGVVMATRSGSVDPGLVLWLLAQGLSPEEVHEGLERRSGLLGLSGTADMRELLARDDDDARTALDVYLHRLAGAIAAMAAALGGVDALVFTAGVGEHAAAIRAQVCENLGYLGLALDRTANDGCQPDADIALPASTGRILVIATREDVTIVRETRRLLSRS